MPPIVCAKVTGGTPQEHQGVKTIADLRSKMNVDKNFVATVQGEPVDDEYELEANDYVIFSPNVKGGAR